MGTHFAMQKLVGTHFYLVALCIAPITWLLGAPAGEPVAIIFYAIARKSARPLAPAGVAPAWAIGNIGNMVTPEKSRRERSGASDYCTFIHLIPTFPDL